MSSHLHNNIYSIYIHSDKDFHDSNSSVEGKVAGTLKNYLSKNHTLTYIHIKKERREKEREKSYPPHQNNNL